MSGASSDSKVFVKLYGEKGDTTKMILAVSDNDLSNYYETGQTDIFTVDTFDVGRASSSDKYTYTSQRSGLNLEVLICSHLLFHPHVFVYRSTVF